MTKAGYAATNKYEYFAIGAVTYLSFRSEDYPYDRADLLEYDLTGFLLQWGVWEANDPTIALSTECGMPAESGDFPAVIREPIR